MEETIGKLAQLTEELLQSVTGEIDYPRIAKNIQELSGAKYVALNIYQNEGQAYSTVAIAGLSEQFSKLNKILGFDLKKKKWAHDKNRAEKIKDNAITYFSSLGELTGDTIPKSIIIGLEKTFDIGNVYVAKILKDQMMIGDFTLIMQSGNKLANEKLVEIYTRQVGLLLTRIQAEVGNIRRDKMLDKLAQQVPGAIFQYQYYPDGKSFFPFASAGIWDVYEVAPEEVREDATLAYSRIYQDDYEGVVSSILHSFHNLTDWEYEYRVMLPQKGVRWLRGTSRPESMEDGSVIWHGYITDITERKQSEEKLRDTEIRLKKVIEETSEGVVIADSHTGMLTYANQAFCGMTGYSPEEVSKISFKELHPQDFLVAQQKFKNVQPNKKRLVSNVPCLKKRWNAILC